MSVWNSAKNTVDEALQLPESSYCANFGFLVEQSVKPDQTLTAAEALINAGIEVRAASQAKIIVLAQEYGVAFTDWAPLKVI